MPNLRNAARRLYATAALPLIAGMLITVSGCAGKSSKGWKFADWDVKQAVGLEPKTPDPETPQRLVATWTETTLSTVGEKPKRGFGGKILFFKRESDDPIRVEGNLVVYAFDETDRPDHETQPTRRYIFPMEEFVRHEGESSIGPAYSFWLPWDEIGGPQRHISLIAKFEPDEGAVVIGEQTRHLLSGTTLEPKDKSITTKIVRTDSGEQVRLATYAGQSPTHAVAKESPAATEPTDAKRQMSTATIPLPQRLSEAVQRQQTSVLDAEKTAATPLALLSTMNAQAATSDSGSVPAPADRTENSTAGNRSAAKPPTNASATGPAEAGSLRDSLLQTLPARARQAGRVAGGRAQ